MEIKIIAGVGKGKSTIAHAIKKFLTENGFKVNYKNDEVDESFFADAKQNARLKSIAESTVINIEVVQINRSLRES